MATVNFSVPEHIKEAFNKAFKGENKSAILSGLMQRAVEEREQDLRRKKVINAILSSQHEADSFSDEDIRKARRTGRP